MEFEKIIDGILRYLDKNIFSRMSDWQEILARLAVSRVVGDSDKLKDALLKNSYFRTFGIIDAHGNVDVDGLAEDLKKQIERKGKLDISIPLFGTFTFLAEDVDVLCKTIKGD